MRRTPYDLAGALNNILDACDTLAIMRCDTYAEAYNKAIELFHTRGIPNPVAYLADLGFNAGDGIDASLGAIADAALEATIPPATHFQ